MVLFGTTRHNFDISLMTLYGWERKELLLAIIPVPLELDNPIYNLIDSKRNILIMMFFKF